MNTWSFSWHGLATVTALELRQRIRSRRWIWALVAWFLVIGGITSLVIFATAELFTRSDDTTSGPLAFGLITFFVLGMGLIIAPTFTATSINADRAAGTLASLQATRLSAVEIASGKLLAAWLTSAVFMVVAFPFLAWAMLLGSISWWQVVVCFAVVSIEVAVVCAIGLGWSAIISRTAGSVVMTYLTVVAMTVISALLLALLTPLTREEVPVRVWGLTEADQSAYQAEIDGYWKETPDGNGLVVPTPPIEKCTWIETTESTYRVDRIWWISVVNPFVIVADAAPLPPDAYEDLSTYVGRSGDPLAGVRYLIRGAARPPATERDDCLQLYNWSDGYIVNYDDDGYPSVTTSSGVPVNVTSPVKRRPVTVDTPIWPWGMATNLLLGAGFFWLAVRRLRIPYGVLTKGTRVA